MNFNTTTEKIQEFLDDFKNYSLRGGVSGISNIYETLTPKEIQDRALTGFTWYFTPNGFPEEGTRSKSDVTNINALYIDIDDFDNENIQEFQEAWVNEFGFYFTWKVQSKNGPHLYFILDDEDITVGECEEGLSLLIDTTNSLLKKYGIQGHCDRQCKDATRLLRIPGTVHWKDRNDPYEITVGRRGETFSYDFLIETFTRFLKKNPVPKEIAVTVEKVELPEEVTEDLAKIYICKEDTKIEKKDGMYYLYGRHTSLGVLAKELLKRGNTKDEIYTKLTWIAENNMEVDEQDKNRSWDKEIRNWINARVKYKTQWTNWRNGDQFKKALKSYNQTGSLDGLDHVQAQAVRRQAMRIENKYDKRIVSKMSSELEDLLTGPKDKEINARIKFLKNELFGVAHYRYIDECDNLRYDSKSGRFYSYVNGIYEHREEILSEIMNTMHRWNLREYATRSRCNDVLTLIKTLCEPFVLTRDKQWYVNTLNGIVDLQTGSFMPHSPDYVSIKQIPVKYNPQAKSEAWDNFLNSFVSDKKELDFLQKFAGYSLSGDVKQEKILMMWGSGGNGKGVFCEAIAGVMGDYYTNNDIEFLISKFGLASIYGKRLCVLNEPKNGYVESDVLKMVTGGGEVKIENKFEKPFMYTPEVKLMVTANNLPRISDTSKGMERRLAIIELKNSFSNNPDFKNMITAPELRQAILNWLVQGAVKLHDENNGILVSPESIKKNVETYRIDSSPVTSFFQEMIQEDSESSVVLKDIYEEFREYTRDLGHGQNIGRNTFQKAFDQEIRVRGLDKKGVEYVSHGNLTDRRGSNSGWNGIGKILESGSFSDF